MAKQSPDDKRIAKMRAMKVNDSFFVEGLTQAEAAPLRQLAAKAGITISIFEVKPDTVHKVNGVRVFRSVR